MRIKTLLFLFALTLLPLSAQQLKTTGLLLGGGGQSATYRLPALASGSYNTAETWLFY